MEAVGSLGVGAVGMGAVGGGGVFFLGCLKLRLKGQLPTLSHHTVPSAARIVTFVALKWSIRGGQRWGFQPHTSSLQGRQGQEHLPSRSSHNTTCVSQGSLGEDPRQNTYVL